VAISFLVSAVIFDLDGVLVDSGDVVERAWTEWASRHGLDTEVVRRSIPGKRTRDAVVLLAPAADAEREAAAIIARESALVDLVRRVPGAREAVARVAGSRWAIATSGTAAIARGRMRVAGFPLPDVFVTAEMVARGKPDPEAYLLAAAGLGVEPAACVVFEDAVSGVAAAPAAGCTVVGVLTSATAGMLRAHYAVSDFRAVDLAPVDGRIRVTLEPAS
jgi:sugar-phosphatase